MAGDGAVSHFPLIVSIVIVIVILLAIAAFRAKNTTWQLTFATGILTVLIIFFFGYGTALFKEQRQIVEAKEQEAEARLELKRQERLEEARIKKEKREAEKLEEARLSSKLQGRLQNDQKRQETLRAIGKQLAEIEHKLQLEITQIDAEIHEIEAKYRNGDINSYLQLREKAKLEAHKQELIIKAMDTKLNLLSTVEFTKGREPKDIVLAQSRRQKAQMDYNQYKEVLSKIEEHKDTFGVL